MEKIISVLGIALLVLILFLLFFTCLILINVYYPRLSKKSRVKWANHNRLDGIVFGKIENRFLISPTAEEGHVFVCGATGEGKTSAIIIPTLLAWRGTAFCIDISGDLEKNSKQDNKLIYDPLDKGSMPYNVFAYIDTCDNRILRDRELVKLAQLIMPDRPNTSPDDRYFNTQGRKILAAALLTYYSKGLDFCEICQRIADLDCGQLISEIFASGNAYARRMLNGFRGVKETTASSCKQACDSAIDLFATDAAIIETFRRPRAYERCITPDGLNNSSVFIRIPENLVEVFSQLMHIITAQCMDFMLSRPVNTNSPILFVLDEFVSLGKLDILPCLRRARKHNIRLMVCTQGMADLDLVYGINERRAMMANFALTAILLATDVETQEYYSRLSGEYIDESGRKLRNIEPSYFGNMENELVVFYRGGFEILTRNYYFSPTISLNKPRINKQITIFQNRVGNDKW